MTADTHSKQIQSCYERLYLSTPEARDSIRCIALPMRACAKPVASGTCRHCELAIGSAVMFVHVHVPLHSMLSPAMLSVL